MPISLQESVVGCLLGTAVGDALGFVGYVHWLRGQRPGLRLDIKRAVAEGDLVVIHGNLHLKPGGRGMAVADFWRIAEGKIVEHWDVIREVRESSADGNTMF